MRGLTIRNLDDTLLGWLRERAGSHGRSLNAELLDILEATRGDELVARRKGPVAASARRAKALGIRTPRSSADVVRAMRDARSR